MRRLTLLSIVLLMASTWPSSANGVGLFYTIPFPALHYGVANGVGNTCEPDIDFRMGWYQGKQAWYIFTGSNDINTNVQSGFNTLFPKLQSALSGGANPVYVVTNYQQGPVFSRKPGEAGYSALWQVIYITWKQGVTKRPITSALALPPLSDADQTPTDIVIDAPIFAIGPIGLPWQLVPQGGYRMKQVTYDPREREIDLPAWFAYGQDMITHKNYIAKVLITDVGDQALATLLQCNYAPGLNDVDAGNTQTMSVFDWTVQPAVPLNQYPILQFLPSYGSNINDLNSNTDFSPIMDLQVIQRTGLPPYAIVRNPIDLGLLGPLVTPVGTPIRINCTVVEYWPVFGPPVPPPPPPGL